MYYLLVHLPYSLLTTLLHPHNPTRNPTYKPRDAAMTRRLAVLSHPLSPATEGSRGTEPLGEQGVEHVPYL